MSDCLNVFLFGDYYSSRDPLTKRRMSYCQLMGQMICCIPPKDDFETAIGDYDKQQVIDDIIADIKIFKVTFQAFLSALKRCDEEYETIIESSKQLNEEEKQEILKT